MISLPGRNFLLRMDSDPESHLGFDVLLELWNSDTSAMDLGWGHQMALMLYQLKNWHWQ